MTTVDRDLHPGGASDPSTEPPGPVHIEGEEVPSRTRRQRRRRRAQRRLTWVAALATLAVLVALPFLVRTGIRTLDDVKTSDPLDSSKDPDAPGYEAFVAPSPTALVVQIDAEEGFVAASLLASPEGTGGGVLLIPPEMVVSVPALAAPWAKPAAPESERVGVVYGEAWRDGGEDGLRSVTEEALGVVVDALIVVGPQQWQELIEPSDGITVSNPAELVLGGRTLSTGAVALTAAEVGQYLSAPATQAEGLDVLGRAEAVWSGWLEALAADPAIAIPGETDRGLPKLLGLLRTGTVTFPAFPLERVRLGGGSEFDAPAAEDLDELMISLVPFAVGQGGDRLAVRVLDGTGTKGLALEAATALVPVGIDLRIVGNASTFAYRETVVIHYDPATEPRAQALVDALGVGSLELRPDSTAELDVTVVVGADFVPPAGEEE